MRAIAPEIVVYTGDFTTYSSLAVEQRDAFSSTCRSGLARRLASWATTTTAPAGRPCSMPIGSPRRPRAVGVQILRNEIGAVDDLQIVGFDNLWSGCFHVGAGLSQLDTSRAAIALCHNPDSVDRPGWSDIRAGYWPVTRTVGNASRHFFRRRYCR